MIYFISKSSRAAGSSRHRAFLVADFLKKNGVLAEVIAPPEYSPSEQPGESAWRRRRQKKWQYVKKIISIKHADTVILQNLIRNRRLIVLLVVLRGLKRPTMIFDLDDASYIRWPWITKILVAISDKIIVASHHLATWPGFGKKPILIVPNMVDYTLADRYSSRDKSRNETVDKKNESQNKSAAQNDRKNEPNEKVVLGWIGGAPASMHNLELLIPVLEKLASKRLPFIFKIIGTFGDVNVEKTFSLIPNLQTEFVQKLAWEKEGEIQKANAGLDIGLCPLIDNEDNRARCSLKILDYMAAGLPTVASPIGENNYFIENGVTGFLPTTTEAWIEDIASLITDKNLREHLGQAARHKLEKEYSYQANISMYIKWVTIDKVKK